MIDEYGNDLPYDFKNIQFKRYQVALNSSSPSSVTAFDEEYVGVKDPYNSSTVYPQGYNIPNDTKYM